MRERQDLPFTMQEYRRRLELVRADMDAAGFALLLVTTPENIYYLTGFNSRGYYAHQCLCVPLDGEPWMVTRRYDTPNVVHQTWLDPGFDYGDDGDPVGATAAAIGQRGHARSRIGCELGSWFFTAATLNSLAVRLPGAGLVDAAYLVEQRRMVKSPAEIAYIREAAKAAGAGMRAALAAIRAGGTDAEIAAAAYQARILAGSEYSGSPVYVQTGPDSAVPHNNWKGRRVEPGDVVFCELGASTKRYHAALMRTAVAGAPSAAADRAGAAVVEGLRVALETIGPGVAAGEVDRAARESIARAGFGANHTLRVGYQIGVGYPPTWVGRGVFGLHPGAPDRLRPGMVFHVIPWIHVPGVGGFGNSATVAVSETAVEELTDLDSRLFLC